MCVQPETCVPCRVAGRTSMGFLPQDLYLGEEIPAKVALPEAEQDTAWCKEDQSILKRCPEEQVQAPTRTR